MDAQRAAAGAGGRSDEGPASVEIDIASASLTCRRHTRIDKRDTCSAFPISTLQGCHCRAVWTWKTLVSPGLLRGLDRQNITFAPPRHAPTYVEGLSECGCARLSRTGPAAAAQLLPEVAQRELPPWLRGVASRGGPSGQGGPSMSAARSEESTGTGTDLRADLASSTDQQDIQVGPLRFEHSGCNPSNLLRRYCETQ